MNGLCNNCKIDTEVYFVGEGDEQELLCTECLKDKHVRITSTMCFCGFETDSYRGLNSHIGNIERNKRMKEND